MLLLKHSATAAVPRETGGGDGVRNSRKSGDPNRAGDGVRNDEATGERDG